jgi:hypothetical protein
MRDFIGNTCQSMSNANGEAGPVASSRPLTAGDTS